MLFEIQNKHLRYVFNAAAETRWFVRKDIEEWCKENNVEYRLEVYDPKGCKPWTEKSYLYIDNTNDAMRFKLTWW